MAAWYLPGQATPGALALLQLSPAPRWRAPHCFVYELPNLLVRQERRGVLPPSAADDVVAEVRELHRVRLEPPPHAAELALAMEIARRHGVSVYDGLYVLLALSLGAPLASRDLRQLAAAAALGAEVVDAGPPP